MTEGHFEGGKFHPHKKNSKSGISSDQVEDNSQDESVNASDAEQIRDAKSD